LGGVKTVVRGPREIAEGLIDRKVTDGLLDTLVPVLETVVGLSVGVMKLGVTNRAVTSTNICSGNFKMNVARQKWREAIRLAEHHGN
jgi:hypothetical protein